MASRSQVKIEGSTTTSLPVVKKHNKNKNNKRKKTEVSAATAAMFGFDDDDDEGPVICFNKNVVKASEAPAPEPKESNSAPPSGPPPLKSALKKKGNDVSVKKANVQPQKAKASLPKVSEAPSPKRQKIEASTPQQSSNTQIIATKSEEPSSSITAASSISESTTKYEPSATGNSPKPTIVSVSREVQLYEMIGSLSKSQLLLGFDAEYTAQHRVATIQLSTLSNAYVLQTRYLQKKEGERLVLANALKELLEDESILKLGVGIIEDGEAIKKCFGVEVKGLVDVGIIAMKYGVSQGYRSLKHLAQDILGIEKGKSIGGWMQKTLTEDQINYAGMDAWLGIEIGRVMHSYLANKSTFYQWAKKNITTPQEIEAYNIAARHRGEDNQERKVHDKYQKQRFYERQQKAKNGYFLKRLEATKKQRQHVDTIENSISSLINCMKKQKDEAIDAALQHVKKDEKETPTSNQPLTKPESTEDDDLDSGMTLGNLVG